MPNEQKIRNVLNCCNHEMAKALLIKKFSGGVIPYELSVVLDRYVSNPCAETAFEIVTFDLDFMAVFELARKDGFSSYLFENGDLQ